MLESVLVVGGAGYIGSHTAKILAQRGHTPVILDDLSTGHRAAAADFEFHEASYADPGALDRVLAGPPPKGRAKITTVMHFGARALVEESMRDPLSYYESNVSGTVVLLQAMLRAGVGRIIFSSTCATFGIPPQGAKISEELAQNPINPYGQTKLVVEKILRDVDRAHALRSGILRYFNAAGADPDGRLGESHDPESHLIPRAIKVALGRDPMLAVYGTDYPTPDGSCVRDYVHVNDLADAHIRAMERLATGAASFDVNLGSEKGHSVFEIVREIEKISGKPLPRQSSPRRPGDPPLLVADSSRARDLLGWRAAHGLDSIISTAYRWMEAHPDGYGD